jgi:hypothetical protein
MAASLPTFLSTIAGEIEFSDASLSRALRIPFQPLWGNWTSGSSPVTQLVRSGWNFSRFTTWQKRGLLEMDVEPPFFMAGLNHLESINQGSFSPSYH